MSSGRLWSPDQCTDKRKEGNGIKTGNSCSEAGWGGGWVKQMQDFPPGDRCLELCETRWTLSYFNVCLHHFSFPKHLVSFTSLMWIHILTNKRLVWLPSSDSYFSYLKCDDPVCCLFPCFCFLALFCFSSCVLFFLSWALEGVGWGWGFIFTYVL